MLMKEINSEIERLEQTEANYQNCNKLAVLYVIRDHMEQPKPKIAEYSYAGSEFLLAASGAPIDGVLHVVDEHMECIKALYPKEYAAIIDKIKRL